mgnify:CR=1 FL=1
MTKSSYIKGKSEEMSAGEKEEREKIREKISAKLKKRIEELDKIIKELEKRKEEEEKSNPGDIDIWLAVLRSLRDEGVALSAIEERTKAVPEINNKLSTIEERTKVISKNISGINSGISSINNKLTYGLAILTILTSLACGLMIKFFLFI